VAEAPGVPSRKAGAWKGSISGVGESALAWNLVGSGAENSEVSSMEGLLILETARQISQDGQLGVGTDDPFLTPAEVDEYCDAVLNGGHPAEAEDVVSDPVSYREQLGRGCHRGFEGAGGQMGPRYRCLCH
jgi:hypothetical protein